MIQPMTAYGRACRRSWHGFDLSERVAHFAGERVSDRMAHLRHTCDVHYLLATPQQWRYSGWPIIRPRRDTP
jgi:hypothetical protein